MLDQLPQLYEVQQIDTAIANIEAAIESLDDGSQLRAELAEIQAEYDEKNATLNGLQSECRDVQLELQAAEEKRERRRTKLYSGTIMNPKELEDCQAEIEMLTTRKGELEERALLLMDDVEAAQAVVDEVDGRRQHVQSRLDAVVAEYEQRLASLQEQLAQRRAEREQAAASVEPRALSRYDALLSRTRQLALVKVEDSVCTGCQTTLTPFVLKQLKRPESTTPLQCESCNRLLYYPDADLSLVFPDRAADEADQELDGDDDS